jgi:hypothetical protein
MGQYFIIVNLDKREYIDPPDSAKLWEICANNSIRMLGYLLATNSWDGTNIAKLYFDRSQLESLIESIRRELGNDYEIMVYNVTDKSGYVVPKLKYFGRWCGDRIVVLGDYADQATNAKPYFPTYSEVRSDPSWTDITEGVIREFNWFIGSEHLKVVPYSIVYKLWRDVERMLNEAFEWCKDRSVADSDACGEVLKLKSEFPNIMHKIIKEAGDIERRIDELMGERERLYIDSQLRLEKMRESLKKIYAEMALLS